MSVAEQKTKSLYIKNIWVWVFAHIRFWTGSFRQIEQFVPKEGTIVDLGCGYGIFANYLGICSSKRKIVGVDKDDQKIKKAYHGLGNVSLKIGDATKMNFKNLDGLILHDVLHHLDSYREQESLLRKCISMLDEHGVLFVVEIDNYSFWKLALARVTDFILYKGDDVFYRFQRDMLQLLFRFFSSENIKVIRLKNNPFPQLLYICRK